jgi:hypothetical protein
VRDFLTETYRKYGLESVTRLLPPRVVETLHTSVGGTWAWLRDPEKLMWLIVALFVALVIAEVLGDRAPAVGVAVPPW